ncbi:hypothetical protein [uncultured Clostridium sp.]|uniref:hypothetical protein n=1 Tax=uncultured Clostridium sp. TaxID=59620 RepID=UPI00258EA17C|nr:hypothetical protein [uncultured Clostridium sp.]
MTIRKLKSVIAYSSEGYPSTTQRGARGIKKRLYIVGMLNSDGYIDEDIERQLDEWVKAGSTEEGTGISYDEITI